MDSPLPPSISAEEIAAQRARVDEAWRILGTSFSAASLPFELAHSIKLVVQTEVVFGMTQQLVSMNKILAEALALIRAVRKD